MSSRKLTKYAKSNFKDKLGVKQKKYVSKVQNIMQFGNIGCEFMGMPTFKIPSINKNVIKEIGDLSMTADRHFLCGLGSSQINQGQRIFIVNKQIYDQEFKNKWDDQMYKNDNYKVIINPKILEIKELEPAWETNPTFPLVKVNARRYNNIRVGYCNEEMEYIEEELQDFPARTFQHFNDILFGKDFMDWRINFGDIEPVADESFAQFPKFFKVINEFTHKVKQTQEDFPELFEGVSLQDMNRPTRDSSKPSWEDDMNKRLLKNIRKDLRKLLGETEEQMKKEKQNFAVFDDILEEKKQGE